MFNTKLSCFFLLPIVKAYLEKNEINIEYSVNPCIVGRLWWHLVDQQWKKTDNPSIHFAQEQLQNILYIVQIGRLYMLIDYIIVTCF